MSLQNQQDFLARLFTDEKLRRNFSSAPRKIGAQSGLSETEIADLQAVLPEDVAFFAESLFWKRLREVEKMLPLTKKVLDEDFEKSFREFSPNYNPQTTKKHLEDAIAFAEYLQSAEVSALGRNLAKFEKTKLRFFGCGERFAVCQLQFDFRNLRGETEKPQILKLEKRTTYAVWLKIGNKIKHFTV